MKFVVEVITIGGGLPDFLGTSCSGLGSSLYSLGMGSVENTVSNSSLIVAFVFVATETSYHVLFIGRSLSKAISSGPIIPVLRCHVTVVSFVDNQT
jgi:hypothetical protein